MGQAMDLKAQILIIMTHPLHQDKILAENQEAVINSQSQWPLQQQFQLELIQIWYSLGSIKLSNISIKSQAHQNLFNLMITMHIYQIVTMRELHIRFSDLGILIAFLVILLILILHLAAQCWHKYQKF